MHRIYNAAAAAARAGLRSTVTTHQLDLTTYELASVVRPPISLRPHCSLARIYVIDLTREFNLNESKKLGLGRVLVNSACPRSGVKRTWACALQMFANDPCATIPV
jgi:hypothetical protein